MPSATSHLRRRPPARGRHHPHPVHRRGPAGQQRPPGRPDGRGADGLRAVDPLPAATRPTRPDWFDRDRFVLRAGHASMLLYSLLHLTGYDLPLDELKRFRQLGSRTPGHPEYGLTPGVEATTGPARPGLRQRRGHGHRGAAPGRRVRPARATTSSTTGPTASAPTATSRRASRRRRPAWPGTCGWASWCSSTTTTTSSSTARPRMAWTEDVLARFDAYGWHTQRVADGNDLDAIEAAITAARADDRPEHHRGAHPHRLRLAQQGRTRQKAHGAPLGPDEVRLTKEAYGWDPDQTFYIPDAALAHVPRGRARGRGARGRLGRAVRRPTPPRIPELAAELRRRMAGELPDGLGRGPAQRTPTAPTAWPRATPPRTRSRRSRTACRSCSAARRTCPESNLTDLKGAGELQRRRRPGRNIRFGVREHAMGGIANGIAYHGGLLPYVATFLTFSDYMRGSVRLAALTGLHVVYVWTHDSIGLGEDGPTHQPVEHYAALRAMPNLTFVRPGDPNEAVGRVARSPSSIAHGPGGPGPHAPEAARAAGHRRRGRATASRAAATSWPRPSTPTATRPSPDVILIATGSELSLAMAARDELTAEGIRTRVVSMPCWERFEAQPRGLPRRGPAARRDSRRVSIEAGRVAGLGPLGRHRRAPSSPSTGSGLGARRASSSRRSASRAAHVASVARQVMIGELPGVVSAPFEHEAPEAQAPTPRRHAMSPDTDAAGSCPARAGRPAGRRSTRPSPRAVDERWASRLWARDTTLWTTRPGGRRDHRQPPRLAGRARPPSRTRSPSWRPSPRASRTRATRTSSCAAWAAARWRRRSSRRSSRRRTRA